MSETNNLPPRSSAPITPQVQDPSRASKLLKRVQGQGEAKPITNPPGSKPAANVEPPVSKPKIDTSTAVPQSVDSAPAADDINYDLDTPADTKKEVTPEEPKKDPIPKEFVPEDPTDEIDQLIDPKDTTGANFKKLRTKLKAVNQERRQHAEALEAARKRLEEYETGVAIPEVHQKLQERVTELEKYEKLYNFKSTPVYQEKFVKPLQEEQGKLLELAKQYEIQPEDLNAAFAAPTAEQNRILTQIFKDDIGALEAKSIFKSIRSIQTQAAEAEKEPAQVLAKMEKENADIIARKRQQANEVIIHTSKEGWSESLGSLREDPRFPEITYKEGDTEHNEKYVRPIVTKAAQEYGRIVKTLAQHGMTELPKDLAVALARMSQLAHLSAVTGIERDRLNARVNELETLMRAKGMLNRPGVNNTAANPTNKGNSSAAVGPQNAGARVLSRVMGNS